MIRDARKQIAFIVAMLIGIVLCVQLVTSQAPDRHSLAFAQSDTEPGGMQQIGKINMADLPQEGQDALKLIKQGGPFPYPKKDGTVFSNREGLLPKQPRGYYKEYTVKTPSVPHRGARRVISGSGGEFYYTDDHYRTFKLIVE
jgi:ribonuclease T1